MKKLIDFIHNKKKLRVLGIFITIAVIALSSYIIRRTWHMSMQDLEENALSLIKVAAAMFPESEIPEIDGRPSAEREKEFLKMKSNLINLNNATNNIHVSYVYVLKDNKLEIISDSTINNLEEARNKVNTINSYKDYHSPFKDGKQRVIKSVEDSRGTWVSVLEPLKDQDNGNVIAVLGMDYSMSDWNRHRFGHMAQVSTVILSVVITSISLYWLAVNHILLKNEKNKLKNSEEQFRTIFEQSPIGISIWNINNELINANPMYEKMLGRSIEELKNTPWDKITHTDDLKEDYELFQKFKAGANNGYGMKKRYIKPDGSYIWTNLTIAPIQMGSEKETNYVCLIEDITQAQEREAKIRYLNDHDTLTNLFNRRYFDKMFQFYDKKEYLPLSIITGDINGLKFINDAFGYNYGNKLILSMAKILQSAVRPTDILARTGGDEFHILLPNTDQETAVKIIEKVNESCDFHNNKTISEAFHISISLGCATKVSESQELNDVSNHAEENMIKRKLLDHKSAHSNILTSIKATMFERSHETEAHAERLSILAGYVGESLNLTQIQLDELQLLAVLHDIGKIGIEDNILNKPGPLTDEEWVKMKMHPEIGYRIAMSSPELVPIADFILSHHERWDGKGYPQGLKGKDIPLASRIIAVVDSYDAMTEDRAYRKALPKEEAMKEIKKNSGTQFDPEIVKIFIEIIS